MLGVQNETTFHDHIYVSETPFALFSSTLLASLCLWIGYGSFAKESTTFSSDSAKFPHYTDRAENKTSFFTSTRPHWGKQNHLASVELHRRSSWPFVPLFESP